MLISKLRRFICYSLFVGTSTIGFAANQQSSDEEAFLIRRIAEFWKDGDYSIVKTQILDFFDKYPKSELKDYFMGILGDIYLQENQYSDALNCYQQIKDTSIVDKIILNKLQCYYECDQYLELIKEGKPFTKKQVEGIQGREQELNFLLGEACFRQSLLENNKDPKKKLATEAKSYYDKLKGTQYEEISLFALAEIYACLDNFKEGANLYLMLAEKNPEMKEDLLFQAGVLQAEYDRETAIETFNRVKQLEGNKAKDAAFNLMVLLFQNEDYAQVISSHDKLKAFVPETYKPTFNFIVGKSYFSMGEYAKAIEPLNAYISSEYIPNDQLKNALLIQMTCAHQTKNEALFNGAFEKLETLFPNDPELPKAIFMHAMILKEQGNIAKADEKLKLIRDNYNEFDDQESFLFEYGLLSHQNESWSEAYQAFKSFVTTFPHSKRIDSGWKLFLSSSLNLYKKGSEESHYGKKEFFNDLQRILENKQILNSEEMKDYSLLYAKMAYELESYTDALRILQDQIFTKIKEDGDSLALAEAHFIAGLCHGELHGDYSALCMHLEQAMLLSPETYNNASTHLQLYNAYISLAGFGEKGEMLSEAEQHREFVSHAAEHLLEAMNKGDNTIKKENRLWLANHYFQKVKNHLEDHWTHTTKDHPEITQAMERATKQYEALLTKNGKLIELDPETLYLENEFMKYVKLIEYQGKNQKKLALLQDLIEQQSLSSSLNWSTEKQALFELASTYKTLGETQKAFETYAFIQASPERFPLSMANVATLESSRLQFQLMDKQAKNESNQEVMVILNHLKELQIRKNANSEPVHLEAALDYAKIRSEIGDPKERDSRYLFFLGRIQDDFSSQEDIVTQDYLLNMKKNPEKKQLFDTYMKFIDAEKCRLKAKQMSRKEYLSEVEELNELALGHYNELKNNPVTPKELYIRIEKSIEDINSLSTY